MTVPTWVLEWLPVASNAAGVLGVPIAIVLYVTENARRRQEREYGTYHALDEKYAEYLKLVIAHPELDLFYSPAPPDAPRPAQYSVAQMAAFELLLSILERAYLMYSDEANRVKERQWTGWSRSIRAWVRYPDFAPLWTMLGSDFEESFVDYINTELRATGPGAKPRP